MAISEVIQPIIAPLLDKRNELVIEETRIADELATVRGELKTIERLLNAADEDYGKKASSKRGPGRPSTSRIGGERMTVAVEWVMRKDVGAEFRQKDMRDETDGIIPTTSITATLFQLFRDEGLIRFVRQEGPNKFYAYTGADPTPSLLEQMNKGRDEGAQDELPAVVAAREAAKAAVAESNGHELQEA